MKKTLLIGDSIRMGYQNIVREQLADQAEVLWPEENSGSSKKILENLDEWILSKNPDIVHINSGLHDLKKGRDQTQVEHIPIDQYAKNVRDILTRIKTESNALVIWALTTPVNEEWHRKNKSFDRMEADVAAYNAIASETAKDMDVPVNDLFSIINSAGRDKLLNPDGVHFTPEGYTLLGTSVANYIKQHLS